jgi:hypothetical protein
MDIYNNVKTKIDEFYNDNENALYRKGLLDCYYLFKRFFYESGIYNQHYLEHQIQTLGYKIANLKYEKSNLEFDLKQQKETYVRLLGISKEGMVTNIKSLEQEVRRLKKLNVDLLKQLNDN